MAIGVIDQALLSLSSPDLVEAYLAAHGWARIHADRGGAAWTFAQDDDQEIWLPRSAQMRSYPARVATLVTTLSEHEDRPAAQILFDIVNSLQDVQRVRSLPKGQPGTIPLNDSPEIVEGLRRWVLSAATVVAAPEAVAVQPSRRPAAVSEFMDRVRLAVPESGSFIWKVAVPVSNPDGSESLPLARTPQEIALYDFGRRVTLTLYNATRTIVSACQEVRDGRDLLVSFEERVPLGVSANLCEALAETAGDRRVPFDIQFSWATHLPAVQSEVLNFDRDSLEIVEQAGVELRRIAPERDVTVQGYVVRLHRVSDQRPGQVTVAGTVQEGGSERFGHFWVELTGDDYHQAVRAHDETRLVSIGGDVIRRGKFRWLENARNFAVIGDSELPVEDE